MSGFPRRAIALVVCQAGAALGYGVTAFALGAWALERTGASASYTTLAAASTLPGVLLAPIAGVVAERFPTGLVLRLANACALVATLALLASVAADVPPGWHLPALLVVSGVGFGLQWPAWGKAMTAMVSTSQLTTAAALLQLGTVAQYVLAPAVAGALVGVIDTTGLLALDAGLLALAIASSWLAPAAVVETTTTTTSIAAGVREAWAFLRTRPALLWLQGFFFSSYFFGGVSVALSTPLLLSITDPATAGAALAVSGTGMLVGVGIALGLQVRRRRGLVVLVLEGGAGLALAGIGATATLVGVTGWSIAFLALTAVSNAASQALWQESVPVGLQVRVFAIRRMLAWGALPVGYVVAGLAADALAVDGSRTAGLALVFIVAGIGKALVSLAFSRSAVARL